VEIRNLSSRLKMKFSISSANIRNVCSIGNIKVPIYTADMIP